MKKIISPIILSTLLVSSFLLVPSHKEAKVAKAADYYASITSNMQGQTLKVALYNIIKGHTKYGYNSLEVAMKITDRDYELSPLQPNESDDYDPYMRLLYADYNGDVSTAKTWKTSQGSYGVSSNYVWNKEHIWAKSNGFSSATGCEAYSDLHHLRASDWKCNNTRSNDPFNNVTHSDSNRSYDWTQSRKTDNYSANGCFEPRDADKGDVARALFYMATRYYNGNGSNGTHLSLGTGTEKSNGCWGYLDTLLAWHEADPVDEFEIHRNDLIYTEFQHNRNPYIDHPEYARAVFKDEPIVQPDTLINLTYSGTPTKTTYKAGESFNPNGLTVTATYRKDDNTTYTENVTSKVSWTPSPLTGNTHSVTGTYSHGGVDKTITINGITVVSLSNIVLSGNPTKTVYEEGDTFDHTGLTLTAYFTDSTSEDVTSLATWPTDPLVKGQMSITVTYSGLSKTYTGIHVKEKTLSTTMVDFKEYTNTNKELSASTIQNDLVSGKDLVTISNVSKTYEGAGGVRAGSGSAGGSIELTLKTSTVLNSVNIYVKKYGSDNTTVKVSTNNGQEGTITPGTDFQSYPVSINKNVTKLTIASSASNNRFILSYVELVTGSGGGESDDSITQWGIDYLFTNESTFDGQGTGLCKTGNYYHSAKVALLSLESKTSGTINKLQTNSKYQSEYNRYMAWARANYDDAPFEDDYSFLSINIEKIGYFAEENSSFTIIIVIIAALSAVTISTLAILKKKRK